MAERTEQLVGPKGIAEMYRAEVGKHDDRIKTVFAKYGNLKVKNSGADFEINKIEDLIDVVDGLK